jgi:hypothetical protein
MDQPNYKVSSGKTTHASNLSPRKMAQHQNNSRLTSKLTNVLSSNSWHFINHRDWAMILMVFLDFHHIKI